MNKILLILATLSLLSLAYLILVGCVNRSTIKDIPVDEARNLISEEVNNPDFVILDVRTPEEFASGHIQGAVNIDFKAGDFKEQLDELDLDCVYLVYGKSGGRSAKALELMQELGFSEVYHMVGGITEWNK
jgi:rhodanese-related sulfurtransferase